MKAIYFASLRKRIGKAQEDFAPPAAREIAFFPPMTGG